MTKALFLWPISAACIYCAEEHLTRSQDPTRAISTEGAACTGPTWKQDSKLILANTSNTLASVLHLHSPVRASSCSSVTCSPSHPSADGSPLSCSSCGSFLHEWSRHVLPHKTQKQQENGTSQSPRQTPFPETIIQEEYGPGFLKS